MAGAEVVFEAFGPDDARRLGEYRALKHRVFVIESGWDLPLGPDGICALDDFDTSACFGMARLAANPNWPIGIVRAVWGRSVPHAVSFERHIMDASIRSLYPDAVATLNAMAVLPPWRGVKVDGGDSAAPRTIA